MSYAQIIYNKLRQAGMTEAGALGVLGNWDCESNCEPYRVQGDFSSYRSISKAYVNALRTGQLTRESFARDQKGFGLAQWTYFQRKYELYDAWKKAGKNIDDVEFQTAFALSEFERDFPNDLKTLKSTNDIYQACKVVCDRFENPAVKNYDARFRAATRIKFEINLNEWSSTTPSTEPNDQVGIGNDYVDWAIAPATDYWPPRIICKGMEGSDVAVLQSVLYARGYMVAQIDGKFGSWLEEMVKEFQRGFKLDVDGIVGPITWSKLLER